MMPLAALIDFAIWGLVFKISGYVSLASIVAALSLPVLVVVLLLTGLLTGWGYFFFAVAAGMLVVWRHREISSASRPGRRAASKNARLRRRRLTNRRIPRCASSCQLMSFQHIGIIGAGGWGTALALLLNHSRVPITLWGHNPAETAQFAANRENAAYLPV
jgi:hypothetical protein